MVAIRKLFFAGALAATVSAAPRFDAKAAAQVNEVAVNKFVSNFLAQLKAKRISVKGDYPSPPFPEWKNIDINAPYYKEATEKLMAALKKAGLITKRDSVLPSVETLLSEAVDFIGSTIINILNLDISSESDAISRLLVELNEFILNLENDLKSYTVTSGAASLAQDILIQSGIQSFVLGLSSIVIDLQAKIFKAGGSPSPAVQAEIVILQARLDALEIVLNKHGLLSVAGTLLSEVGRTVKSILSSL